MRIYLSHSFFVFNSHALFHTHILPWRPPLLLLWAGWLSSLCPLFSFQASLPYWSILFVVFPPFLHTHASVISFKGRNLCLSHFCSFSSSVVLAHIAPIVEFSHSVEWLVDWVDIMDCSTPGLPVHHQLLELAQSHVHRVSDGIHHLILCCPLLLLPSIFPSIRVFSNESALHIRWPKYWCFSCNCLLNGQIKLLPPNTFKHRNHKYYTIW